MKKLHTLYKFFFPDDSRLKIEAVTEVAYNSETKQLTIHRKFFTFRSLISFLFWYVTKNPYEKAKRKLEKFKRDPMYVYKLGAMTALFLITCILDIKNIHNVLFFAGSIAYNATTNSSSSSSPITFSHTTSGSDRGLTVTQGGLRAPSAVTYNGVSLSGLRSETPFDTSRVEVWGLINPDSGTNTVSLSFSPSGSTGVAAISFSGADSFGNTAGSAALSGTVRTNSLTTTKANSIVVESQWKDNCGGITQNDSQTEVVDQDAGGSRHGSAYKQIATAGSNSFQFTGAGAASLIGHALVEVKEKTATAYTKSITETAVLVDTLSRQITAFRVFAETITLVDTVSKGILMFKSIVESLGISDKLAGLLNGVNFRYRKKYSDEPGEYRKKYRE